MPSSATSNSGTTVFGRWVGKRSANSNIAANPSTDNASLTSPSEVTLVDKHSIGASTTASTSTTSTSAPQQFHRRDSSILSLTTANLTDLGANVRRSVSLRSHRTTPSNGSNFGGGSKTRSPSSGNGFSPLSNSSPTEGVEDIINLSPRRQKEQGIPTTTSPRKDPVPPLRRKISLSAKNLSQKFARSTDALPALNSAIYLDNIGSRSPEQPLGASPVVGSQATNAFTSIPPTRKGTGMSTDMSSRTPGLHPQGSFSRSISSSHGEVNGAPPSLAPGAPSIMGAPLTQKAIYAQIQETSAKRMATIDYLRKLHEGDIFYFGTMHYSQAALTTMPSLYPHKLGRRATNYFLLGYSLPVVLDLNAGNALEYLKALSSLLAEFETYQNLSGFDASGNSVSKGRMGQMFKSGIGLGNRTGKGRRSSTTADSLAVDARQADLLGMPTAGRSPSDINSPVDLTSPINPTGHEFAYLLTPHLPFDPDFNSTLGTLCDTLIDVYAKLSELVSSPEACNPSVGTEFAKADKAIRKILVANVVKEFEESTRAGIKGEMAGLGRLVLGGLS